jgi:hypothetical protein
MALSRSKSHIYQDKDPATELLLFSPHFASAMEYESLHELQRAKGINLNSDRRLLQLKDT